MYLRCLQDCFLVGLVLIYVMEDVMVAVEVNFGNVIVLRWAARTFSDSTVTGNLMDKELDDILKEGLDTWKLLRR